VLELSSAAGRPERLPDERSGRIGTPQDIARGVLFLLTNDFVNGTVLDISGGRDHFQDVQRINERWRAGVIGRTAHDDYLS
jgi:NAD(P)-dependent dehydrogenase (short-subunit alcohol dehydrogenase family)